MKKTISALLSLVLLLLSVSVAFAAETTAVYYVDAVSGSDAAAGTSPETAWKTLAKANAVTFRPGDRLLLKSGATYAGGFYAHGSGSAEAPVLLSSYGEGSRPLIDNQTGGFAIVLENVSYWTVENLEITAPGGKSLYVRASGGKNAEYVTVQHCVFRDISLNSHSNSDAAVFIDNDRSASRVRHLHLDDLKITNVPWGVQMEGIMAEYDSFYRNPAESFNSDYLLENLYISNAKYGGIVLASVRNATVRNCRVLNSATAGGGAYAPLWTRHTDSSVIEYCEIAGSTNGQDGMAIDFDGWSTNNTARYIYSHDNTRFMRNCVYDSATKNAGNSVYNCVSVNDNGGYNFAASMLISFRRPSFSQMSGFSFHDNMIVNGKPILWFGVSGPSVSNNYFRGSALNVFMQKFFNIFSSVGGFTYSVDENALQSRIAEITANLPNA